MPLEIPDTLGQLFSFQLPTESLQQGQQLLNGTEYGKAFAQSFQRPFALYQAMLNEMLYPMLAVDSTRRNNLRDDLLKTIHEKQH